MYNRIFNLIFKNQEQHFRKVVDVSNKLVEYLELKWRKIRPRY